MDKVAIIIPAYNEESSITKVVESIQELTSDNTKYVAVVINDASTDNTAKICKQLPCVFIDLPVNLGIGGAVQSGYKYAFQNQYDYAVQVDGDGQHPISQVSTLLQSMKENKLDVVIGSRFIQKEGFQSTLLRRLGIKYLENLIHLLTGQRISDATSGFRMFNKKVLALVSEDYPDEYPEPESMVMFLRKGFKVQEIPVVMHERQGGTSSIRYFKQLYYFFKVSLAILYTFLKTKK